VGQRGGTPDPDQLTGNELMDQTLEQWRPVIGYGGLYEVSNWGRVKSLARTRANGTAGALRQYPEKILASRLNIHGYWQVGLSKEGVQKQFRVHVLVAAAFLGPRPDGLVICHGPGGKQDNRPCNLSYKTQAENMADKYRDGTEQRGERNGKAKLTEAQVRLARRLHEANVDGVITDLAKVWGVHKSAVWQAVHKKSWAWLDAA
jgi:hypothetical protein